MLDLGVNASTTLKLGNTTHLPHRKSIRNQDLEVSIPRLVGAFLTPTATNLTN